MKNPDHPQFEFKTISNGIDYRKLQGKNLDSSLYLTPVTYATLDPFTSLFSRRLSFQFDEIFIIDKSFLPISGGRCKDQKLKKSINCKIP